MGPCTDWESIYWITQKLVVLFIQVTHRLGFVCKWSYKDQEFHVRIIKKIIRPRNVCQISALQTNVFMYIFKTCTFGTLKKPVMILVSSNEHQGHTLMSQSSRNVRAKDDRQMLIVHSHPPPPIPPDINKSVKCLVILYEFIF